MARRQKTEAVTLPPYDPEDVVELITILPIRGQGYSWVRYEVPRGMLEPFEIARSAPEMRDLTCVAALEGMENVAIRAEHKMRRKPG